MSENTYDLSPSKQAYQAVKADVTPVSAFKELIDNALDNWTRVLQAMDPLTIEIEYYPDGPDQEEQLVVRDSAGGVEEDDVSILFALGQSKKERVEGAIGAYGVGAKKAIVNLGNNATIKSRHLYADTGFGFEVDQEWLEEEDDWEVDKLTFDDIEEGVTEIAISDLNISWDQYDEDLVEDLGRTYQYFLDSEHLPDKERVEIIIREYDREGNVDSERFASPPEETDWSYTPIDGLYPRRYEDINLESREFDDTVRLHVTVGLLREADAEAAGADIFCQNREVLSAVRDERAGFGTGAGSTRLPKFSGQHRRLKVRIEFETDGDAQILPWDAQKSDIDQYNRVAQAAYSWIRRIVKPYHRASGNYTDLPTSLLSPYDRSSEFAVTTHLEDPYDYGGDRERVTDKANSSLPEAKEITEQADRSALVQVYDTGTLSEKFIPAYRSELVRLLNNKGSNSESELDDFDLAPEDVPSDRIPGVDIPEDPSDEELVELWRNLGVRAEHHASLDPAQRDDTLPPFQQALYDRELRLALRELGNETPVEELPSLDVDEETGETEDGDSEAVDSGALSDFGSSSGTDGDSNGESGQSDSPGESGQTTSTLDQEHDDAGVSPESSTLSGAGTGSDPTSGPESDSQSGTYLLELSEDEWSDLTDALGLDEDASASEVRERLMDTTSALQMLRN